MFARENHIILNASQDAVARGDTLQEQTTIDFERVQLD